MSHLFQFLQQSSSARRVLWESFAPASIHYKDTYRDWPGRLMPWPAYKNWDRHDKKQHPRTQGTVSNDQDCVLAAVIIGHLNSKAVVLYLRVALRPMGRMINNMIGKEKNAQKNCQAIFFYAFHQTFSTSQFKLNPSGYGNHYWNYLKKIKDI